ncbi:MAG: hypothetical protein HN704_13485 [Bacteroidetes bacterium]|jgi:hypothetical protein|nr:hypothetical protein [Bacteroidota bacterium]MBT6684709.1 hypothetical protein [Bacteroidota bacterium]MBT7143166.1 hypothetical protein [Bacteroidota bacterium]MBT7492609.1 hypothetical protein [Bacteroidota bacterium]
MKNFKLRFVFFSILLITTCLSFNSCVEPEPPKATITVVNEAGFPVHLAQVRVFSSPNGSIVEQIARTDPNGQTFHTFKYEAILDVEVEYVSSDFSYTLTGSGVVILEEDKTYEETVTIR